MKRKKFLLIVIAGLILSSVNVLSQVAIPIQGATASSSFSGTSPDKTYNGNASDGWKPVTTGGSTEWITFDLGTAKIVTKINFNFSISPINFSVYGSNLLPSETGYAPVLLNGYGACGNPCAATTNVVVTINTSTAYRYIKITGFIYSSGTTSCTSQLYMMEASFYTFGNTALGDINNSVILNTWDKLRVQATSGNIDIGAQDANWAYINTDRPNFLFKINSANKLTILSNGNIGVGITNPSATLDVNGNILMSQTGSLGFRRASDGTAIPMISVTANGSLSNLQIGSGSGQFSGGYTDIYAGGTCKIRILGNGYVGIGTTTIPEMLTIAGNIKSTGTLTAGSLSTTGLVSAGSLSVTGLVSAGSLSTTGLVSAGSLKISGNVGIGTASTTVLVTIKGKIIAGEIQVVDAGTITPDYVFKSDYKLMSLHDVETFVKKNSHLPEVPSVDEFRKDGMNISQMNKLLLKKVEELTLYLIEQNKKLEEQNKRIETLEKENGDLRKK